MLSPLATFDRIAVEQLPRRHKAAEDEAIGLGAGLLGLSLLGHDDYL